MEIMVFVLLEICSGGVSDLGHLIKKHLDSEVFTNSDVYSKLFYDIVSKVRSFLRISSHSKLYRNGWTFHI